MKRTMISHIPEDIPCAFYSILKDAPVFDSSCSPQARVYYIEKDCGFYLKSAPAGTLRTEAEMTSYFYNKGLSAQVLGYESSDRDWLLTAAVPGEDCVHPRYLEDPRRLCDTTAELLRMLHNTSASDCPVNRTQSYVAATEQNYRSGRFDISLFPENPGFSTADEAWHIVQTAAAHLKSDALLHGDYCLPNVRLDNWRFSGFIDVGNGGLGDRHIDLFWGIWTLNFNFKTSRWADRFLDAYGRDRVEPELLRAIAAFEAFG